MLLTSSRSLKLHGGSIRHDARDERLRITSEPHDDQHRNGRVADGAVDFSVLGGFDLDSVTVRQVGIAGYMTVCRGAHPLGADIGECCGDVDCPYGLFELTVFSSLDDLAARHIRDVIMRWPDIPASELLRGLLLDVYEIRPVAPIPIADLRNHPVLWRVPVSIERLRAQGFVHLARNAPEWELIRLLKDGLHVGGIELPAQSSERGRDFALHRDHADQLSFERLGAFEEVVPSVGQRATDAWVVRLLERFFSGGR